MLFRGVLEETLREDFQADEDFRGGVERGGGRNSEIEPKPGGQISDSSVPGAEKIIPDFNLDIVDGELQLSLNTGDIPELRLNKSYVNMLEDYQKNSNSREKKDVVSFVKYKLSSARSFIVPCNSGITR